MTDVIDTGPQVTPAATETAALATETPAQTEAPVSTEAVADAEMASVYAKLNPNRDEFGRFKQDPAVAALQAPATETTDHTPEEAPIEPAKPAIDAPNSWSAEAKAKWASLSPDLQEVISKRESEAHARITQMGQQVKAFEPVNQILEQNRSVFDSVGMQPAQAISALIEAHKALTANPVAAIHKLATDFGVDLASLYGGQANGSQQPPAALLQELASLRQQVADLATKDQSREQQTKQAQFAALTAQVEEFQKSKEDFALVENEIALIIPALREQHPGLSTKELLEKAYDKAVRLNDDLWAKKQEAARKAAEAKAAEDAKKKADAAKKAGAINVRSGAPASSGNARDLDGLLLETYHRARQA